MKLNKKYLTYVSTFLVFVLLFIFDTVFNLEALPVLIGTIIGVFLAFMAFDSIFVKLIKLSEVRAVWYSFVIVLLFFIFMFFRDISPNAVFILILQLFINIIFLLIFLQFARKDEKEKIRLLNLPDDSNLNLNEVSIISNKSERELKHLIAKGILSLMDSNDDDILFNKGKVLNELKTLVKT